MPRRSKTVAKKDGLSLFAGWLAARPLLTELTLTAITVLFGMQVLRVFVPGMFWTLGARTGLSTTELGIICVLIFLTGFLAGPLGRLAGNRRLVLITAVGLGIMRLAMQLWWGEPLFNLGLAIAGVILFFIFLPAGFEEARLRGGPAIPHYALGLLAGLALDIAINGAFSTYDTVWQVEPLPVLLTLLLVIIQMILLIGITPKTRPTRAKPGTAKASGVSLARSFTWLAMGPFLFLELVVFQNIPRVAVLTGCSLPIAFGLTLLAQLAGLAAAAALLVSKPRHTLWPWALGTGIILPVVLTLGYQEPIALTAVMFLVGQVLLSMLIVMVLIGITTSTGERLHSGAWIANGFGLLLLLAFIFAYYAVYDISLPYENATLEPIAGGIIAACAICALVFRQQVIKVDPKLWLAPVLALILLALPLAQTIMWRVPTAADGQGFPVRIMTYNLHNGFNTKGKLNMEELAQVIEQNNPDVVALQEVSRGWLISGRVDMLEWLSQRLQMPYVSEPTADQFWGNAILSRYPILAYSRYDLPPRDLFIRRGFILALIDIGNDQQIKVINTHFHHVEGQTEIRQLQSKTIIDFLSNIDNNNIILLGDLNAETGDQEIAMLYEAEFLDTAIRMNSQPAYTFASDNPHQKIDYILITQDLRIGDVQVPLSTASDHLPIVALIYK
jgi:endonuclease/exonuclease/phosphatase family metal-dependent hydrolase